MENVNETLKKVILENCMLEVSEKDINENTSLINDLAYDSVAMVELITELELQFNVEFEDEDIDIKNLETIGTIRKMLESKINN